ncbi:hypothetical protein EV122DRAFT_285488 [Schizophyllum commune]
MLRDGRQVNERSCDVTSHDVSCLSPPPSASPPRHRLPARRSDASITKENEVYDAISSSGDLSPVTSPSSPSLTPRPTLATCLPLYHRWQLRVLIIRDHPSFLRHQEPITPPPQACVRKRRTAGDHVVHLNGRGKLLVNDHRLSPGSVRCCEDAHSCTMSRSVVIDAAAASFDARHVADAGQSPSVFNMLRAAMVTKVGYARVSQHPLGEASRARTDEACG